MLPVSIRQIPSVWCNARWTSKKSRTLHCAGKGKRSFHIASLQEPCYEGHDEQPQADQLYVLVRQHWIRPVSNPYWGPVITLFHIKYAVVLKCRYADITETEEYYPTRTEDSILKKHRDRFASMLRKTFGDVSFNAIELGAGKLEKQSWCNRELRKSENRWWAQSYSVNVMDLSHRPVPGIFSDRHLGVGSWWFIR